MIIDKTDLVILRHLERTGRWISPLPEELKISSDEIWIRIKNMEQEGVITGYKPTIFVPPFLGGDWGWGCILATATERERTIERILQRIPFVTEIWLNTNLPSHLGHNFSFIFYSKDFDTEIKFLKDMSDISYLEAYRITDFSFPMARIFSSEETLLLRTIFQNPTANADQLAEICKKNPTWVQTKQDKLIWTPQNTDGVLMVLPEIKFRQLTNFCHCHFIAEFTGKPELFFDEFKTLGYNIVLDGRPFQGRYLQLEVDVWGFNDFIAKKLLLENYKEIKIQGVIFSEEMRVISDWGIKLVNN